MNRIQKFVINITKFDFSFDDRLALVLLLDCLVFTDREGFSCIIPAMEETIGYAYWHWNIAMWLYYFNLVIGGIVSVYVCVRYPLKKILFYFSIGCGISCFLMAWTKSFIFIVILRGCSGFFAAPIIIASLNYFCENSENGQILQKTVIYFFIVQILSTSGSYLIFGSFSLLIGWRFVYVVLSFVFFISAALVFIKMKRKSSPPDYHDISVVVVDVTKNQGAMEAYAVVYNSVMELFNQYDLLYLLFACSSSSFVQVVLVYWGAYFIQYEYGLSIMGSIFLLGILSIIFGISGTIMSKKLVEMTTKSILANNYPDVIVKNNPCRQELDNPQLNEREDEYAQSDNQINEDDFTEIDPNTMLIKSIHATILRNCSMCNFLLLNICIWIPSFSLPALFLFVFIVFVTKTASYSLFLGVFKEKSKGSSSSMLACWFSAYVLLGELHAPVFYSVLRGFLSIKLSIFIISFGLLLSAFWYDNLNSNFILSTTEEQQTVQQIHQRRFTVILYLLFLLALGIIPSIQISVPIFKAML